MVGLPAGQMASMRVFFLVKRDPKKFFQWIYRIRTMEKICRFPKQGFAPKLMYTYNQKACVGTTHPKKILWKVADLFPCSGLYQGHLSKLV